MTREPTHADYLADLHDQDRQGEHEYLKRIEGEYDDRRRLWQTTPPGVCAICLGPTEPSHDLCVTCDHDEDVLADHYRRDHQ